MDQRLDAKGLDLARDRIRFNTVAARIYDDGRTGFRQRQRNRAADIAPCSRDDGDFAGEFVVVRSWNSYSRSNERSIRPL